jgi:hypothetical protein
MVASRTTISWQVKITASTRPGRALARWPGAPADAAELVAERRGNSVVLEEDMESSLRKKRR